MSIRKIFVSKQGGIGDVILATPVLRALKKHYPESYITLLVLPNAKEVVAGLPYIDSVCLSDRKLKTTTNIIRKIWNYDLAVLLDTTYRPALMSFLALTSKRVGIKHKRGLLLNHPVRDLEQIDATYEPYNMSKILKQGIGLDLSNEDLDTLDISPSTNEDRDYIDKLFLEHGIKNRQFVAVAPFTAFPPKDWPVKNYEQLIQQIQKKFHLPAVLLGTSQNHDQARSFKAYNFLGKTSFMQMVEIIRRSTLLIGSCSGHIHASAAVNTPSVALYGPSSPKRWHPQYRSVAVSLELPCSPCWTKNLVCDKYLCMQKMSVDQVFAAVEQAMLFSLNVHPC